MPPPDETMPQNGRLSSGPHSNTGWVNPIGVPAVVVSGGFYASGLPFGLEFSARQWKDGDLLGWAYAYEQATQYRKPPVLVEKGLLAGVAAPQQTVPFPAQDGGMVYGDLYGTGDRAVVLAHGGRFTKESWDPQARILAAAGFRALTIEFRQAEEGRRFDILAAVH